MQLAGRALPVGLGQSIKLALLYSFLKGTAHPKMNIQS